MSLSPIAQLATAEPGSRQHRRNASILTLVAERLRQASSLATALPPDWQDGAALPIGTQQAITRELATLVRTLAPRRRA
jgi:hypothetical protein